MFTKKVLCLGNNDESTDVMVSALAVSNHTVNHGLISEDSFVPLAPGYYHTTVLDMPYGGIINLAAKFDLILFLDQDKNNWSNWKPFLSTYKLMLELEQRGCSVQYKQNQNIKNIESFNEFLANNKSFCIYPWINFVEEDGDLLICSGSPKRIMAYDKTIDWKTNSQFQEIRRRMLAGETLPDHCETCYYYERRGVESYRQFETKEWINKLDIYSLEDLEKIDRPYYYEIRLSNKCNLMCRGCNPAFSHLIDQEFQTHNIMSPFYLKTIKYSNIDRINIDKLDHRSRVYLTGGDPTVIPEVFRFMELCIQAGRTDFELTLGTNGQKISERFLRLSDHFSNLNFSISMDGYGRVNDYWRWGSNFETIIDNARLLQSRGHHISINTVPGIYNVTNLHLLYEFLDREFPHTSVYSQLNYLDFQSPYNHPNAELCLESLSRVKQTQMYLSDGKSNKTAIDSMYDHYSSNPQCDLTALKKFFNYNDQLDRARGSWLGDYIPELEACRSLLVDVATD
mgnify:CR=1 FL=1